jgi:hypothetical protein
MPLDPFFNANTVDDLAKAECNGFALTARAEWSKECKPKGCDQLSAEPPNEEETTRCSPRARFSLA